MVTKKPCISSAVLVELEKIAENKKSPNYCLDSKYQLNGLISLTSLNDKTNIVFGFDDDLKKYAYIGGRRYTLFSLI